jgi:hypothetical protein
VSIWLSKLQGTDRDLSGNAGKASPLPAAAAVANDRRRRYRSGGAALETDANRHIPLGRSAQHRSLSGCSTSLSPTRAQGLHIAPDIPKTHLRSTAAVSPVTWGRPAAIAISREVQQRLRSRRAEPTRAPVATKPACPANRAHRPVQTSVRGVRTSRGGASTSSRVQSGSPTPPLTEADQNLTPGADSTGDCSDGSASIAAPVCLASDVLRRRGGENCRDPTTGAPVGAPWPSVGITTLR